MLRKMFVSFLPLFFVLAAETAFTQEDEILNRLYGSGVHAYNSRAYRQAYHDLTAAIETGNMDPRTRYFLGLAYLKLGRPEQAQREFYAGAKLEFDDGKMTNTVDRSLIRIQGPDRYMLENARVDVQRGRYEKINEMRQRRFRESGSGQSEQPPPIEDEPTKLLLETDGNQPVPHDDPFKDAPAEADGGGAGDDAPKKPKDAPPEEDDFDNENPDAFDEEFPDEQGDPFK